MERLTSEQERIWSLLQNRKGRKRALTAKQLARLVGASERRVRENISELRRQGHPIASAVHPPYGFFVPETPEEAHECLGHLYSRIREIGQTAAPLEKAFGRYVPGRQMVFKMFAGEGGAEDVR